LLTKGNFAKNRPAILEYIVSESVKYSKTTQSGDTVSMLNTEKHHTVLYKI